MEVLKCAEGQDSDIAKIQKDIQGHKMIARWLQDACAPIWAKHALCSGITKVSIGRAAAHEQARVPSVKKGRRKQVQKAAMTMAMVVVLGTAMMTLAFPGPY